MNPIKIAVLGFCAIGRQALSVGTGRAGGPERPIARFFPQNGFARAPRRFAKGSGAMCLENLVLGDLLGNTRPTAIAILIGGHSLGAPDAGFID